MSFPLSPEHHLSPALSPTSWRRGRRYCIVHSFGRFVAVSLAAEKPVGLLEVDEKLSSLLGGRSKRLQMLTSHILCCTFFPYTTLFRSFLRPSGRVMIPVRDQPRCGWL